ncbi:GIY-YIG nuclease family protein [candidate division TA06 bacterium]|uniref:GIY-YIG nuclease family protein n=1 Tax=candidate division TA06 bacterium TaxID=2250710 RepID=A0A933IBT1_UNCT6|nr:GIY-YIG nuclease family protein [candidate division TA06 bacterium]
MYWVYIIQSITTKNYYTGYTSDLVQRLKRHNANQTKSIKNSGPFVIVHTEEFKTKEDAFRRERQIKRYKSGNAFKKLVNK